MEFDECCTIENDMVFRVWFSRYRECRNTRLPDWVSSLHPKRLPCRVAGESITNDQHGSFNITCKIILDDGEACAVRFPMIGRVKYPDEKLTREVEVMNLICNHTSVPIPKVIAWGVAAGNTLGLGPFLITSYVEGVSLGDILRNDDCDNSRMMREDISDYDIETIYRQIAHIQLQLSRLDFDRIGSPCASSHEEKQVLGPSFAADDLPSNHVRRSSDDGSAWFYQIMRDAFNSPANVPFQRLLLHMPELAQSMLETAPEEVESFVQLKLRHLKRYENRLQEKRDWLQRRVDGYECVPDIDQVLGKGERQE